MLEFHCPLVADSNSLASCWQVSPVKEDFHGSDGAHQASVATLYARLPSAYASGGNSSTLATVASFGLKPCCADCFHMVAKSGGSGTLVKKSAPDDLNWEIIEE